MKVIYSLLYSTGNFSGVGSHPGMMANKHITLGNNNSYEKEKTKLNIQALCLQKKSIHGEICWLKAGNSCYYSVHKFMSSRILINNLKIQIYKTILSTAEHDS